MLYISQELSLSFLTLHSSEHHSICCHISNKLSSIDTLVDVPHDTAYSDMFRHIWICFADYTSECASHLYEINFATTGVIAISQTKFVFHYHFSHLHYITKRHNVHNWIHGTSETEQILVSSSPL